MTFHENNGLFHVIKSLRGALLTAELLLLLTQNISRPGLKFASCGPGWGGELLGAPHAAMSN
jgi:hypothetical protein